MPFFVMAGSNLLALDGASVCYRSGISKEHSVSVVPGGMID